MNNNITHINHNIINNIKISTIKYKPSFRGYKNILK